MPSRRRQRAHSRGQSLVELALIAPVFLLLLLTAIDLGRLLYSQVTITNAAKEAALVASQGGTYQSNQPCGPTNTVMCGALTEAQGGFVEVDKARVTLTPATCVPNAQYPPGGPPTVTVSVSAPFRVVTPIIGQIVGSNLVLSATADAECLVVPEVTFPSLPNPTAAFTASPTSGSAPLLVNFNATGSFSPGATITSYSWSFGGSGPTPSFTFAAGSHTVTLTVTDSRGQTDQDTTTITVSGGGGGTPTPTPPPTCASSVDFTAVNKANGGHPHRMDLAATLTPNQSGWTFTWTGSWSQTPPVTGPGVTVDFVASGSQSVQVTATKSGCPTLTKTKAVTAP
jgi:Flp pilus assembly protein TadG